jgi:hypothetical protein
VQGCAKGEQGSLSQHAERKTDPERVFAPPGERYSKEPGSERLREARKGKKPAHTLAVARSAEEGKR